jgi:hypothetical protein
MPTHHQLGAEIAPALMPKSTATGIAEMRMFEMDNPLYRPGNPNHTIHTTSIRLRFRQQDDPRYAASDTKAQRATVPASL